MYFHTFFIVHGLFKEGYYIENLLTYSNLARERYKYIQLYVCEYTYLSYVCYVSKIFQHNILNKFKTIGHFLVSFPFLQGLIRKYVFQSLVSNNNFTLLAILRRKRKT